MRYIETIIIVDHEMFEQFNRDKAEIIRRCNSILSLVNNILKPLMIQTVLKGVEFVERDEPKYNTTDVSKLLKNFTPRRFELLREGKSHDYMTILSGHDFNGTIIGRAYVGTMCENHSVAIVQHFPKNVSLSTVAMTIVHEMGHTLGAQHDDLNCSLKCLNEKCIMASVVTEIPTWSNCSLMYIAKNIDRFHCLKNVPILLTKYSHCGNGIIDKDEQCDCGPVGSCSNPCCEAKTCKLKSHAVCASGICCDLKKCSVHPAGKLCRSAASECDLPEFCSGASEHCPSDVFKQNGQMCHNGQATCYKGFCGSLDLLCQRLVTPSAKHPNDSYVISKVGRIKIRPCQEVFCLTHLYSQDRESRLLSGDRSYYYYLNMPLLKFYLQDSEGLSCQPNMTCVNKKCRALSPEEVKPCPLGCSNNGVCNSKGNCHCDVPYSPPNCLYPGYGGSIDSGLSTNLKDYTDFKKQIYLLFLGIIPVFALTLCLWTNAKFIYTQKYKEKDYPYLSRCLNGCCCPCMSFLSRWLCNFESRSWSKIKEPNDNDLNCDIDARKTICQVDMDIEPPEAEVRSWGVASDALMTDVIIVTPKVSPSFSRKVRLPSSSPILRTKSYDNLSSDEVHNPKLTKSTSKDSGHGFLGDKKGQQQQQTNRNSSFKSSISNLISMFQRYERQQSQISKSNTTSGTNPVSPEVPLMEPDLRKIVVDPFSSLRNPKYKTKRPRSFSTDPKPHSQILSNSQYQPVKPSLQSSEQHLHLIAHPKSSANSFKKEDNRSSRKVSQTSLPALPPKRALIPSSVNRRKDEDYSENKASTNSLPKKPLLPPKMQ
ncbi:UNVERIFIED_CONTAM: hypothetical protein RMT77_016374 [Armadillidium vulgare]